MKLSKKLVVIGMMYISAFGLSAVAENIAMTWQLSGHRGNLFIREEHPKLLLQVSNQSDTAITLKGVGIKIFDQYNKTELPSIEVGGGMEVKAKSSVDIPVDLGISKAGVYDVTANYENLAAKTQASLILGPQPEEDKGEVPFFATCSHAIPEEWAYQMRREFGSRFERERTTWQDAADRKTGELKCGPLEKDKIVTVVKANGSQCSGSFASTIPYASPNPDKTQEIVKYFADYPDLTKYQDWVDKITRHYLGVITYWEVHNEPNGDGGFIRAGAEQVGDLHKLAALTARNVSPDLKIIGATTVSIDPLYLDRLRDSGALDYMDVIAFHQYRWDYSPDAGQIADLKGLIEWRDKNAPGRPLWDDEWGPFVKQEENPERYAELVARHIVISKAMGVEQSTLYTWDGHPLYRIWFEDFPTPGAIAYRTTAQQLTNAVPAAIYSEGNNGVFGYVFRKNNKLMFIGWTADESKNETISNIPVNPNAKLYDLMGNDVELPVKGGKASLSLTCKPVFLVGVQPGFLKNLQPCRIAKKFAKPKMHPTLWCGFKYPDGSEVFSMPKGQIRTIKLHVHNIGKESAKGVIFASSSALKVLDGKVEVNLKAGEQTEVNFRVKVPENLTNGIYNVDFKTKADGLSFGRISARCYVANGETKYCYMGTWEMAQNWVDTKNIGGAIKIMWVNPEGYIIFKFDLSQAKSAEFAAFMDSVSPAPKDGGTFRISVSRDKKEWKTLLEGSGWLAWRSVNLTPYVGGDVYVRFDNSSDKGAARIREMKLTTFPVLKEIVVNGKKASGESNR